MSFRIKTLIAWTSCLFLIAGATFSGHSDLLCKGKDGNIEYKAACQPCCAETEGLCKYKTPGNSHNENDGNSNCSDEELGNSLWSEHPQKLGSNQLTKITFSLLTDATNCLNSIDQKSIRITGIFQLSSQSPLSKLLATTILRC